MQLRHGYVHAGDKVQIIGDEAAVLESAEQPDVYYERERQPSLSLLSIAVLFQQPARGVVYQRRADEQQQIKLLAPRVKQQRENYQNIIFHLHLRHYEIKCQT